MAAPPAEQKLPLRPLGSTGLRISALGFGASALGGVFDDFAGEDEGIAAVLEAHSLGVNYFDTSPFYGATRSERVLGRALAQLPRDSFVVSTKVGRYGENEFDFSAERIRRSVDESLERLQLERVDLLLAHDVEFGDLSQIINETLPALQQLKKEGKCSFVGITGLPLGVLAHIVREAPSGSIDVVLSYCHHCLCDTSLEKLLPGLAERGIGVINASPLSMGLLSKRGPPTWHPAPKELRDACAKAAECAEALGEDVSAMAVAFSVANEPERVASTLVSMATRELVRANVAAALGGGGGGTGSGDKDKALPEVEACLAPVKDVTWPSGRPENNGLSAEL